MPNIGNTSIRGRDTLLSNSRVGALGAGLEYRTRRNIYPGFSNFAFWASGIITTTRRTLGMPLSSVNNIGTYPDEPVSMVVASTSAADSYPSGTGARKITIRGLDKYWEEVVISNIELDGQTPVTIPGECIRINRIFVDDVGSSLGNVGDIYVSDGSDTFIGGIPQDKVFCAAIIGENSDTWGQHTVAAHRTNYLVKGNQYHNGSDNIPVLIEERYTSPNFTGGRTEYSSGSLWYTTNTSYNFDGAGPIFEKSDITFIATSSTGLREGSVYYEVMEKDDLLDFDNTFSFNQVRNVFG